MTVVRLLHFITQQGYKVEFTDDFEGMISITYFEDAGPKGYKYIRHEHLGFPGADMEKLTLAVKQSLGDFASELEDGGKPRKDGLAE